MKRLHFPLLAICIFFINHIEAQDVKVHAHMDSTTITLGDQVSYKLEVIAPSNYTVYWPSIKDTIITGIEIVKRSSIDTLILEKTRETSLSQKLFITSFDSGYYAIPPVVFTYKKPGDTALCMAETEALLLTVNTIAIDTTQPIKPIKGPVSAPYTLKEALPWIIGALLLTAIIYAVYYIRKRRKESRPLIPVPSAPALPDYEIALRELERLRGEKVWQKGLLKEYHTQLTDILRQYLFNHFGIPAHEMTSDEILDAMNRKSINRNAINKLRDILILADLVKFAKEQPLPAEHDISMNQAIEFVKSTLMIHDLNETAETKDIFQPSLNPEISANTKPSN